MTITKENYRAKVTDPMMVILQAVRFLKQNIITIDSYDNIIETSLTRIYDVVDSMLFSNEIDDNEYLNFTGCIDDLFEGNWTLTVN